MTSQKPTSPLILALDVPTGSEALTWVDRCVARVGLFKIGMQLFYREGPTIVREVRARGAEIFLDLKLHDIPNTVAKACESLMALDVRFLTVHLSGGLEMLQAAQAVVAGSKLGLLGVTALTSLDQASLKNVYPELTTEPSTWAIHLAKLAETAGLEGIICSAHENTRVRAEVSSRLCLVNPGIRPSGADIHDQKRVMTPRDALAAGGNYLVIGRPILAASDPMAVIAALDEEISLATGISSPVS